jgi:hypothetical protein
VTPERCHIEATSIVSDSESSPHDQRRAKIYVAGATGAIGPRLVLLLVSNGHMVIGTTRPTTKADGLRVAGASPSNLGQETIDPKDMRGEAMSGKLVPSPPTKYSPGRISKASTAAIPHVSSPSTMVEEDVRERRQGA